MKDVVGTAVDKATTGLQIQGSPFDLQVYKVDDLKEN